MARVTHLTVRELIERLSQYDPGHRVVVSVNDADSPPYGVYSVDAGGYSDDLSESVATRGEDKDDYPDEFQSCWDNPCVILTVDSLRQLRDWGVPL